MNGKATTTQPGSPVSDFTKCPQWGQGGRFRVDPGTGARTRVEADAALGAKPAATSAAAPAIADAGQEAKTALQPGPANKQVKEHARA